MHHGETSRHTKHTLCRLSTQFVETGTVTRGDWQSIKHAGWLQADADELNEEHQGKIWHWLEYQ